MNREEECYFTNFYQQCQGSLAVTFTAAGLKIINLVQKTYSQLMLLVDS
jgi:hypothetical protein